MAMLASIISAATRHIRLPQFKTYKNCTEFLQRRSKSTHIQRPLCKFFSEFPGFQYDPTNFSSAEIKRLVGDSAAWKDIYKGVEELKQAYRDALAKEFNNRYGTDGNDLSNWQKLAKKVGLDPIPDTLEECREMVTNTHVNIIDLLHAHGSSRTVQRFASVSELSEYTIGHEMYFPKKNANAGNLLQYLLRHIYNPEKGNRRRDGSGKRKSKRPAGRVGRK